MSGERWDPVSRRALAQRGSLVELEQSSLKAALSGRGRPEVLAALCFFARERRRDIERTMESGPLFDFDEEG